MYTWYHPLKHKSFLLLFPKRSSNRTCAIRNSFLSHFSTPWTALPWRMAIGMTDNHVTSTYCLLKRNASGHWIPIVFDLGGAGVHNKKAIPFLPPYIRGYRIFSRYGDKLECLLLAIDEGEKQKIFWIDGGLVVTLMVGWNDAAQELHNGQLVTVRDKSRRKDQGALPSNFGLWSDDGDNTGVDILHSMFLDLGIFNVHMSDYLWWTSERF